MPSSASSQLLRAVTDRGEGSPILALTSTSNLPQHADIQCIASDGVIVDQHLTIAPAATALIKVCSTPSGNHDTIAQLLAENDKELRGPFGIAIAGDGMAGSLSAFALNPHSSEQDRYFSSVPFSDPSMAMSTTTVFPGVPVGRTDALAEANYVPTITLSNFSSRTEHVILRYSHMNHDSPETRDLELLTIPSGHTREVSFDPLQGDPTLQNSFMIVADGKPGDLLSKLVSRGGSQLHEVELLGKDLMDANDGGNHPWSLQNGSESTLILFNTTSSSQYFNISIASANAIWKKAYHLQALETRAISLHDLITTQVKDDNGKLLPANANSGQLGWYTPESHEGTGRLVESNRNSGMARNFSCGQNIELCGATFSGVAYVVDGQTIDLGTINTQVCMNSCSGTPVGSGGSGYSYFWSSGNASIASISGTTANPSVNVYGASLGSTYMSGSVFAGSCQAGVAPPATVVSCPSSVTLGSLTPIPITDDATLRTGYGAMASMQLPPGDWSKSVITETVTPTTNNCPSTLKSAFTTITSQNSGTFRIGGNATPSDQNMSAVTFPSIANAFYDEHSLSSTSNTLTTPNTCSASAAQTYVCGGNTIGSFTITKTFTVGTANGGPATIVSITKK